jgi:Fur family peroxide stress response transcriptional regulator
MMEECTVELAAIVKVLKERGIRPTAQRIGVYQNIVERHDHPTVDMLYHDMHALHPSLSKTTVYNTLDMLVKAGLVKPVTINSNEARFDANTSLHGHFQCTCCGKLTDFYFTNINVQTQGLEGYEIGTKDVYFTGRCPQCSKN